MTHSKVLSNDGSSGFLLNDGSSFLILNAAGDVHVAPGAGVQITGTHARQKLRRPQQLIPVEYTFQLLAGIFNTIEFRLLRISNKLNPLGFYSDNLRQSFVLPLTEMRSKLKAALKYALEDIIESDLFDEINLKDRFRYLLDKIRRKDG